jgi:asparagine N-glycosylation enzyme membrane subunit Stt3
MEFEVKGQAFNAVHVESGVYPAKLAQYTVRQITTRSGEERSVIIWTFEITAADGTYLIDGMTSTKFSVGRRPSKAVQWVQALLGRELKVGEKVNLDLLLGKECMVKVEDRKIGDTVVSRVTDVIKKVAAQQPAKKKS